MLEDDLKRARKEIAELRAGTVSEERIARAIREAFPPLDVAYEPAPYVSSDAFKEHQFVLLWSDVHAGEFVDPEAMSGINRYDWQVMTQRHETMQRAVRSFKRNRPYPVNKLTIAALGDMLSGDIHEGLKITNEVPITQALKGMAEVAAPWIAGFIEDFAEVEVVGVVGNHPRVQLKPEPKQPHNNFDWLLYDAIASRLGGYPQISFRYPRASQAFIDIVGGRRMMIMHGDGIRSTMVGVPWGGVNRRAERLNNQFSDKKIDCYAIGHFHTPNVIELAGGGKFVVNGSVIGPNEFALKTFGYTSPAAQLLLTFHPTRGLTDISYLDLQ